MTDEDAARQAFALVTAMASQECGLATDLLNEISDAGDLRKVAMYAAGYASAAVATVARCASGKPTGPELLATLGPRLERNRAPEPT